MEILEKYKKFTWVIGDISSDGPYMAIAKDSFDLIIHLAAQAGVQYSFTNPEKYTMSNLVGFSRILEFAAKDTTPLIYASSSSVYGDIALMPWEESMDCSCPLSYYAATKLANEHMAYSYKRTHKLPSIGLRFFTVYGPWGRPDMAIHKMVESVISGHPFPLRNDGRNARDFTYVDDVVRVIMILAGEAWEGSSNAWADILNVGGGKPITIKNLVRTIENIMEEGMRFYSELQPSWDIEKTFASVKNLRNAVGYSPHTSIKEGLKKYIDWHREYYG
jgi:UDP-glucuronate 4-epimerase